LTTTGDWWFAGLEVKVKPALGRTHAEALGDGLALGLAEELGLGEGDGDGVADGAGVLVPVTGSVSRLAIADPENVTFWLPPKNTAISGVNRRKCPVTWTVTVLPMPVEQSTGLQLTLTSVGAIETPPLDSSLIRQ
jgi:hypothetical protein